MAGASDKTMRVRVVNANYQAAETPGDPGTFELLIVTEDDERHVLQPAPQDLPGLLALVKAQHVLLWDPVPRTLIAANLIGEWLPADWSALRDS